MRRNFGALIALLTGFVISSTCSHGAIPSFDTLESETARAGAREGSSDRVISRNGQRYYRFDGSTLFAEIAADAYGDPDLWYVIYRANEDRLEPGSSDGLEDGELLLLLPDPPESRTSRQNGKRTVTVLPGDTFMSLSKRLYGTPAYWKGLYAANKDQLPDPEDPFIIFGNSGAKSRTFVVPGKERVFHLALTEGANFGATMEDRPLRAPRSEPDSRSVASQTVLEDSPQQQDRRSPPDRSSSGRSKAYQLTGNSIRYLELDSASDIGYSEARLILSGTGLLRSSEDISKGLKRLHKGYTYSSGGGSLNSKAKERLFREYKLLRSALNRWWDYPNIGSKTTPNLVDRWIRDASKQLKSLPSRDRYPLLKSLLTQESGVTHWKNFKPVVGTSGDTGFGQFLPATARKVGINPYDPEQNIHGVALYIEELLRSKGSLREALAAYNGGNSPPPKSYRYAVSIMQRSSNIRYA